MAATLILQKECEAAGIQWVFGYSLTFTDGIEKIDAKNILSVTRRTSKFA